LAYRIDSIAEIGRRGASGECLDVLYKWAYHLSRLGKYKIPKQYVFTCQKENGLGHITSRFGYGASEYAYGDLCEFPRPREHPIHTFTGGIRQ